MASIGYLFGDNALSTLAGTLSASSTSVTLALGTGAKFPAPASGQYFAASLTDAATKTDSEIVLVTNVTGDVLTVVRGQEGTSARSWVVGDFIWNGPTGGQMAAMAQSSHFPAGQKAFLESQIIGPGYSNSLTLSLTAPSDGNARMSSALNLGGVAPTGFTSTLSNNLGIGSSGSVSQLSQTQFTFIPMTAGETLVGTFTVTSPAGSYGNTDADYGFELTFTPTD